MIVTIEVYADQKRFIRVTAETAKNAFDNGEIIAITTAKRDRHENGLIRTSDPLIIKKSLLYSDLDRIAEMVKRVMNGNLVMFFVEH